MISSNRCVPAAICLALVALVPLGCDHVEATPDVVPANAVDETALSSKSTPSLDSHAEGDSETSAAGSLWLEAVQELRDGNDRFVRGESKHPHDSPLWRHRIEHDQHPFATILGCADSRVCPELVFDQGFGDLFVIRVAGNIVDPDVAGSIEYAVDHLETPLIVVLGHDRCGAVSAALDSHDDEEPAEIVGLLQHIRPACADISETCPEEERVRQAVEANVRLSMARLREIDDLAVAVSEERVVIVGAVYDLRTGRIRYLDEMTP